MPSVLVDRAVPQLFRARAERAIRRARSRGGSVLVSATVSLPERVDPAAVVFASRRPGEPWFCFENPDRQGAALATLGCVTALEGRGPGRFGEVSAAWRALASAAICDAPDGPGAAGPVAVGGFAFAEDGGAAPHWRGFA